MGKPKNEKRQKDNEARAVARMLRVSPQKLNLLAQLIRGKKVDKALNDLAFSRKRSAHGLAVVAIRLYVLHSSAELMLSATVENRDGVTSLEQICHKRSPKEARTADYQTIHSFVGVWLVVILKSQVRDEVFAAHPS